MMLEDLVPLSPVHFFSIQADCPYFNEKKNETPTKKQLLPDLSSLHGESPFCEVALAWNENGLYATLFFNISFATSDFPDFQAADSIEFLIDTRDVKTSGFNTRFCHHFYFLPEPFLNHSEPIQAGEITRFRTEDAHELCDGSKLKVHSKQERKRTTLSIFIPAECLHGYDPLQFDRLGFTYRINRLNGNPQYFAASSEDFSIEQQPSLWASLRLIKEKK